MAIEVAKIVIKSVQDAAGLEKVISKGQFTADEVIAVIGKTEGNGGVNDFTRILSDQAFRKVLRTLGSRKEEEIQNIPMVWSGGCDGVITPHATVFAKNNKTGIIVCKDFHNIHSELLENFYSYMQDNNSLSVNIKFILLTEVVSFIPDSILNCCEIIHISRPTKIAYTKCSKQKFPNNIQLEHIINIKHLHIKNYELMYPYKIICDKIIKKMIDINELKFIVFRDLLYDIFIYNLNITDCIWYILTNLTQLKKIKSQDMSQILLKTYNFLKYYNNNYRPIYHLESYLFYLTSVIHDFS